MSLTRQFLKNGFIYSFSILFAKAGHFLSLPIFLSYLEPEDFGVIGLVQFIVSFCVALLDMGASNTIQRFYFEWGINERQRREGLGSFLFYSFLFAVFVFIFLLLIGKFSFNFFIKSIEFNPLGKIALLIAIFQYLTYLAQSLMRIKEELKLFTIFSAGLFLSRTILSLIFVVGFNNGVNGYIDGLLYGTGIVGVASFFYLIFNARINMNMKPVRAAINYSLPIGPTGIMETLGGSLERLVLERYASLASVGLFTLGNQLGQIFNVFNQIIKSSFIPMVYKMVGDVNDKESLAKLSCVYLGVITCLGIFFSLFIDDLIFLLGKEKYYPIIKYGPLFIFGYWVLATGTAFARGIDLSKKSYLGPLIPLFSVAVNLIFSYWLIPDLGVMGAIYAFLMTCVARTFISIFIAYIVYPRPTHGLAVFLTILPYFVGVVICFLTELNSSLLFSLLYTVFSLVFVLFVSGLIRELKDSVSGKQNG